MLSAGVWRRDRMIERHPARIAAEPVQPAAAEPAPILLAGSPHQPYETR